MKHLYLDAKFRQFNNTRSQKALRKRARDLIHGGVSGAGAWRNTTHHPEQHILTAPSNFSVINNTGGMQHFFYKLANRIDRRWITFVDLSSITALTPDAVLTLLALLDRAKESDKKTEISGNAPASKEMRRIFLNSGFYQYVSSAYRHEPSDDILAVEIGNNIQPEVAGSVVKFARKKLNLTDRRLTSGIYTTIMETMINVTEHAYDGRKQKKWFLMALNDSHCKRVQFALMDNGFGIPATVKKKFTEKFLGVKDSDLLVSTLKGEARTQTNKLSRGNGLPKVRGYALQKKIGNLFVISKSGYYNADKELTEELEIPYLGTLITWDFIPESCNEN